MKVPESAQAEFEPLVTRPLRSNAAIKRELKAYVAQAEAVRAQGGISERALETARGALALAAAIDRTTSPLYVRLIHASGYYAMLHAPESRSEASWERVRAVVNAAASAAKRFERVLPD